MFVMLSLRSTSVCERYADIGKDKNVPNATTVNNIFINNNNSIIAKSFDHNINYTDTILGRLNNEKQPSTQQVSV